MTPRQFADLAAAVSRHAEELSSAAAEPAVLHRVWKRSARCCRGWREELVGAATPALYAELFAAELPLRVWCTAVAGRSRAEAPGAAVAAKIFADLLDVRCMALQALAADHGLTASEAAAVDRFRRRCERWADVLVGPIAARTGVTDFAVRPDRAADFGSESEDPSGDSSWPLVTAGLRLAFTPADGFRGPEKARDASAAGQLAAAIVATFLASAFGGDGLLRPAVVGRAARVVDERRPAKARRKVPRSAAPAEAAPDVMSKVEVPRSPHAISFASLRKRRPEG